MIYSKTQYVEHLIDCTKLSLPGRELGLTAFRVWRPNWAVGAGGPNS